MSDKAKATPKQALPIPAAAEYLGVKPQYVRTLIRNGKFKPNKVRISEDSQVWRWEIPIDQLDAHAAGGGARTRRADGRSKFVLYATPEEHEKIAALVAEQKLAVIIERAYQPKKKEEPAKDAKSAVADES